MAKVRRYLLGFLYRTFICLCLFLLCLLAHRLWPEGFEALKEKFFYPVNYGRLASELKELGRCVLPR